MTSLSQLNIYSSSESEEESTKDSPKERLPMPQLPCFNVSRAITREPHHDESLHQGRIRTIPHSPGNWATFVFIPMDRTYELMDYIEELMQTISCFNMQISEDFHVSLTRTVILKHHWIQSFIQSIQENLKTVKPFITSFNGIKVYSNEQKTRTFVALQANYGTEDLRMLVKKLDKCLLEYNLEVYYENPSFHLSILWCVGDKSKEIEECLRNLPLHLIDYTLLYQVTKCCCTTGNKNFAFNFSEK